LINEGEILESAKIDDNQFMCQNLNPLLALRKERPLQDGGLFRKHYNADFTHICSVVHGENMSKWSVPKAFAFIGY
jgi:hypothetical protein